MLILFQFKKAFVGHFLSELQKCFQLALLLTRSLTILGTAVTCTDNCVRRANENAGNVVQFSDVVFNNF